MCIGLVTSGPWRYIYSYVANALVPEASPHEDETDRRYKWPDTDQIRAELIPAGGETLYVPRSINKSIHPE
jgi:hypothetical protein